MVNHLNKNKNYTRVIARDSSEEIDVEKKYKKAVTSEVKGSTRSKMLHNSLMNAAVKALTLPSAS